MNGKKQRIAKKKKKQKKKKRKRKKKRKEKKKKRMSTKKEEEPILVEIKYDYDEENANNIYYDGNIINSKEEVSYTETNSSDSGMVIFYVDGKEPVNFHLNKNCDEQRKNKQVEEFEKEMYRTLTFDNFHHLIIDCIHNKNTNDKVRTSLLNPQQKNSLKESMIRSPNIFLNLQESFHKVVTNKKLHENEMYSEYTNESSNQIFEIMQLYHIPFLFYYVSQINVPSNTKNQSQQSQPSRKYDKMSNEPYFVFDVCNLLLIPYMYVFPEKRDVCIDILKMCTVLLFEYKTQTNKTKINAKNKTVNGVNRDQSDNNKNSPHQHEARANMSDLKSNYFTSGDKQPYINEKEVLYHIRKTSKLYFNKKNKKTKGIFSKMFF